MEDSVGVLAFVLVKIRNTFGVVSGINLTITALVRKFSVPIIGFEFGIHICHSDRVSNLSISLLAQILGLLLVILRVVFLTWKTKSVFLATVVGYLAFIAWGLVFTLLLPVSFCMMTGDKAVYMYFPESIGLAGILFMGWFHCLIISLITKSVWRMGEGNTVSSWRKNEG